MYREHVLCFLPKYLATGLSLCIQGTCFHEFVGNEMERFIPVYTGNMIPQTGEHQVPTVYPCVYREHLNKFAVKFIVIGLSLCIQGTLYAQLGGLLIVRFIPVYTGNIYQ